MRARYSDQTPPRQLFARNDPALSGKALIDLGFAPAMSFYIKFDDESLNGACWSKRGLRAPLTVANRAAPRAD